MLIELENLLLQHRIEIVAQNLNATVNLYFADFACKNMAFFLSSRYLTFVNWIRRIFRHGHAQYMG